MLASGPSSSTRAVERAMDLLAEVCDQGEIGLAECARRAGLAPSTALRLLRTLETSNLVSRDERGLFRAGPRLIQLGAAALSRQALVVAAEPALQRIVGACSESTYLCLPGPTDTAVYAGMVEGLHSVRHTSWIGRSIPLRGTAAGAAFRGEVPPSGHVVMRSAVEPDVTAIAAPVCRPAPPGGRAAAVAVISVVGPTYRIDDEQAARIGAAVSAEARLLGEQFAVPTRPGRLVIAETG
ncbi:DNA-binding transcriptional regulator, IclR family [Nakamurella panacisegetis]|uniref:DNA-binding transcriptional regulator, IclR family n=2 Tax=Nakamurella panacisegetis TaxID=1090615 RepID=A0A1H0NVX7_9ACTN|nr:DNA-binding transcriptional regulator, IclR family [Nakamurella panacisegetis]